MTPKTEYHSNLWFLEGSATLVQNETVLKKWRDVEAVELSVISACFSDL